MTRINIYTLTIIFTLMAAIWPPAALAVEPDNEMILVLEDFHGNRAYMHTNNLSRPDGDVYFRTVNGGGHAADLDCAWFVIPFGWSCSADYNGTATLDHIQYREGDITVETWTGAHCWRAYNNIDGEGWERQCVLFMPVLINGIWLPSSAPQAPQALMELRWSTFGSPLR